MSNRFTSISAINASVDNLTTGIVKAQSTTGINVVSDINMNNKSITNLNTISLTNYEIVEDYINKTIGISVIGTPFRGGIYDTFLNKPYEQILPLSPNYRLPQDLTLIKNDIVINPYKMFIITPTENVSLELPSLISTNIFQNTHVRFTNQSSFLVSFIYNGEQIIQMGYETISLVWRTINGVDYTWIYIP